MIGRGIKGNLMNLFLCQEAIDLHQCNTDKSFSCAGKPTKDAAVIDVLRKLFKAQVGNRKIVVDRSDYSSDSSELTAQ
jgi:hypothetical protein